MDRIINQRIMKKTYKLKLCIKTVKKGLEDIETDWTYRF